MSQCTFQEDLPRLTREISPSFGGDKIVVLVYIPLKMGEAILSHNDYDISSIILTWFSFIFSRKL
jgi:hypothetical protein